MGPPTRPSLRHLMRRHSGRTRGRDPGGRRARTESRSGRPRAVADTTPALMHSFLINGLRVGMADA